MQEDIESLKRQWLILTTLSKEIIDQSDYSEGLKQGNEWRISINRDKIDEAGQSSRSLASCISHCINEEFAFWENLIDIWTELFWKRVKELGIHRDRHEPIKKALERGRLLSIGEAMLIRYEWDRLLQSGILKQRYTPEELTTITRFIAEDETKRLKLLKKCLRLQRVAWSDYLKYGEAIAYFTRGKLFEDIRGTLLEQLFTREEIGVLDAIWKLEERK